MRKPTGIIGLDALVEGGFNEGSSVLVTGKTGTAKTIFCLQFLCNGAKYYGEPGIFMTTEEIAQNLRDHARRFKWDLESLERAGKIKIIEIEPFSIDVLFEEIESEIKKMGAKRVVIDSVSMFELYVEKQLETRKLIYKILRRLKEMGIVIVITSEIPEDSQGLSRFGVIEFVVDTVIVMQFMSLAKYKRSLMIRKMRDTNHSTDIHPLEITPDGIAVYKVS